MNKPRIWGRANSVNVQKVLWCCEELRLEFERTDAGMQFGKVDTPEYRAMNPNGRIPTLEDGDVILWESHSILRYLAMRQIERQAGPEGRRLYPEGAATRARVERWLDWTLSTVQPAERNLFWGMVRTPPEQRDMVAIRAAAEASGAAWHILDSHLAHGLPFLEGENLTLADIALGAYVRRWFGVEVEERPELPRLHAWYDRLNQRPGYRRYVAPPMT
ncbi:glutathione S-transferase family protein [Roseomonas marmotae]|uniref:Glutathione S-transferase n=1 Tax=Roseomonas marmotae TaxID=2768161 RepID=A0ABS3KG41_9PROT|nr:glutathione S-transferase [Roseomonas marmotae]MBO1076438.1 glutathione S-transferase [Roseomonas marmotae]QTI77959.1 glutathione S-transferase [Roseomonas marmotae]